MRRYIIKRVLYAIPVIFFVTLIVFSLINAIPGDPVRILYGESASDEMIETVRARLNLDKPITIRYMLWLGDLVRGDMGKSLRSNEPVLPLVIDKFSKTLILAVASLLISTSISIISGVIAAYKRNTIIDFGVMAFAVLGISIPSFWMGIMLVLFFSVFLNVLPSIGYVSFLENPILAFKHLILPAVSLGFAFAGYSTRMTRSQMIEVLNQDYIRTARAKGVIERIVIFKHALKNAMVPIVTVIGLQLGILIGGQIVVEQIFVWPGIGGLLVKSIFNRDYTVIQGIVLVVAIFFIFINIIVDVIYAFLNPKIRFK